MKGGSRTMIKQVLPLLQFGTLGEYYDFFSWRIL